MVKPEAQQRLTDSVETALRLAGGTVTLEFVDLPEDAEDRERVFSEHLACPYDGLSFEELEPRSFSFNSPFGACPDCTGLGTQHEVDPDLVIPDPDLTLADGAVAPWSTGTSADYFTRLLGALGDDLGFDLDNPWRELPTKVRNTILRGQSNSVTVVYRNRYGRQRLHHWLRGRHLLHPAPTRGGRDRCGPRALRRLPGGCPAPVAVGLDLPVSLAVTIDGRSIAEISALPIERHRRCSPNST